MAADLKIQVAVLSEPDSRSLFQQKAGDVVNSSTHQTYARDIVRECKGLPLAIVTLGRALANKGDIVFADTLKQLQKSIYFDRMSPVTASIRLSYKFLQNDSTKLCFLLSCLFPEDFEIKINALFCYVMGERILKDVDNLEEARKRLHISSCLLIKNEDGDIMMHDVVRDVAISIASEEGNEFIVKAVMRFVGRPDIELEKCKRLSLMDTTIRCGLPDHIKAPQLLTLLLHSCKMKIPHELFKEMKSLLTLDVSRTYIHSLPSSISTLTNLRTLCMDGFPKFVDVSSIEKLERL
ncbi:hypothetical protein IFM89_030183 [Coptis chinensis]|uniref:NB-ARC domain-containing protein n=1 Tax=Coptis chinensis TaxID=261450 RepID=A0A835LC64_9MAGN|nr:hypothetical protein IFM89_030183 [Coptis chinensis]